MILIRIMNLRIFLKILELKKLVLLSFISKNFFLYINDLNKPIDTSAEP